MVGLHIILNMAAEHRLLIEDSFYHVYNRGIEKKSLYNGDLDCNYFLKQIKLKKKQYGIKILAFCLMGNHYHLLLHDKNKNLPHFMRSFTQSYGLFRNTKNNSDGANYKGPYKSKLINSTCYFQNLIRYIHLNPVAANLCKSPLDWKYSSYKKLLGLESNFDFVDADLLANNNICPLRCNDILLPKKNNGEYYSSIELACQDALSLAKINNLSSVDLRDFCIDFLRNHCMFTRDEIMSKFDIAKPTYKKGLARKLASPLCEIN